MFDTPLDSYAIAKQAVPPGEVEARVARGALSIRVKEYREPASATNRYSRRPGWMAFTANF
jgi:hypothetical protein